MGKCIALLNNSWANFLLFLFVCSRRSTIHWDATNAAHQHHSRNDHCHFFLVHTKTTHSFSFSIFGFSFLLFLFFFSFVFFCFHFIVSFVNSLSQRITVLPSLFFPIYESNKHNHTDHVNVLVIYISYFLGPFYFASFLCFHFHSMCEYPALLPYT